MAISTRTKADQDMSRHALGHVCAKLSAPRGSRTTFVIVEGADDLAFYGRFFDRRVTSLYYSTKLDADGNVKDGGCEELQKIVGNVLNDKRTDKVVGIMDTDYRRYKKRYICPSNIYLTDYRDMEMTALHTPSVQQSLSGWIADYESQLNKIQPILHHAGTLRILNDVYQLGCNFKKKVKIGCVYEEKSHRIYPDWKKRYNSAFKKGCLKNKKQKGNDKIIVFLNYCRAKLHKAIHSYQNEDFYYICQGHDFISLLSKCLVKTSVYSEENIWTRCFYAYSIADFKGTRLYDSLHAWESNKGLSLFRRG